MDTNTIVIVTAIIAVAISVYAAWRSHTPVTLEGAQELVSDTVTLASDLNEVALVGVKAAQQLKETGKINTNDEAFQHAVNHVERWFGGIDLDPQVIANAVEAAYFALKKAQSSLALLSPYSASTMPASVGESVDKWLQTPKPGTEP